MSAEQKKAYIVSTPDATGQRGLSTLDVTKRPLKIIWN